MVSAYFPDIPIRRVVWGPNEPHASECFFVIEIQQIRSRKFSKKRTGRSGWAEISTTFLFIKGDAPHDFDISLRTGGMS